RHHAGCLRVRLRGRHWRQRSLPRPCPADGSAAEVHRPPRRPGHRATTGDLRCGRSSGRGTDEADVRRLLARSLAGVLLLALSALVAAPVSADGQQPVRIESVDTGAYPDVSLVVGATGALAGQDLPASAF